MKLTVTSVLFQPFAFAAGVRLPVITGLVLSILMPVTVAVSALGWWRPPAAPVEIAIAVSVAAAAVLNMKPLWQVRGAWLAFGFGFIHGFGFANALADLGLARGEVVAPLLGFNLGVELGQLLVVAVVLPVLFALRARPAYVSRWLPAASAAIVVAAVCWTVSRWPA